MTDKPPVPPVLYLPLHRDSTEQNRIVTVLTAAHPDRASYIRKTAESVLEQDLPDGWELEWVIQQDGELNLEVADLLAGDPRVKYRANWDRLGRATTRNIGLSRARGELVQSLDDDDMLLPGALAAHIAPFDANPSVCWVTGRCDDLHDDGSRQSFPSRLPTGLISPGTVNADAALHGIYGLHCAGLMYKTVALRAHGGWAASPFDTATSVFAALSETKHGWLLPDVTWLYRQHAGQSVRDHNELAWGEVGRHIAAQRAQAIAEMVHHG